jgi:hypothetical protein
MIVIFSAKIKSILNSIEEVDLGVVVLDDIIEVSNV